MNHFVSLTKEFQEIPLETMRKMNQMDQDKKIH